MAEIQFIEDAKEILSDIKKKTGKKGLYIILGGLGVVGAYLAYKSFNSPTKLVPAEGYSGYPTADENSDSIISELTDEVTASQDNILYDMDTKYNKIMEKFDYTEMLKGYGARLDTEDLTNGSVGGDFVSTDKGKVKDVDTSKKTSRTYVENVTPNYFKGSDEEKFNKFMDEVSGKPTYTQTKTADSDGGGKAGSVSVEREKVTNEFGGHTSVNRLGDTVTITKTDANNVVKSVEKKHISEL